MEEKDKTQFLGSKFYGSVTFHGPMFDIHDNKNVYINNEKIEPQKQEKEEKEKNEGNQAILENLVFDDKKFNNQEKLYLLKDLIDGCFTTDVAELAQKDCKKINPLKMNQFFCLYSSLYSLKLLSDEYVKNFVHQLALWFPQMVNEVNEEKIVKAIYDEQSHWKQNGVLVPCMEWQSLIGRSESKDSKRNCFRRITQEIYANINQLVKTLK